MSFCLHDVRDDTCDDVARKGASYVEVVSALARAFQSKFQEGTLLKNVTVDTFLSDEEKNSASDTLVAFARVNNCLPEGARVVMKWYLMTDANVKDESEIYSCGVYRLVQSLGHPCFAHPLCVAPPGTAKDARLVSEVRERMRKDAETDVGFIMTEYCGKHTFEDHASRIIRLDVDFYSGVIQMIRALEAMAKKDLVHGDLHFGNVMFPTYGEVRQNGPPTVTIPHGDGPPTVTKNLVLGAEDRLVKIFDWDHSLDERGKTNRPSSWKYILLLDKIGFLRQLNDRLDFEANGVLEETWLPDFVTVVRNTATPDKRHPQATELAELMKINLKPLEGWVAGALSRLESFAFREMEKQKTSGRDLTRPIANH
jgi:hypothetical protein